MGEKVKRTACIKTPDKHQGNFGQTKVDEDKDTVDYQTTGGKAENFENGFSLSCANSGQKGILALILGILQ